MTGGGGGWRWEKVPFKSIVPYNFFTVVLLDKNKILNQRIQNQGYQNQGIQKQGIQKQGIQNQDNRNLAKEEMVSIISFAYHSNFQWLEFF